MTGVPLVSIVPGNSPLQAILYAPSRALGFVQMYPVFESIAMRRKFIFNDFFVLEQGRKRGVGKGLIEACAAYARALGASSLGLSTARDNHTAQALYRATGWQAEEVYVEFNLPL